MICEQPPTQAKSSVLERGRAKERKTCETLVHELSLQHVSDFTSGVRGDMKTLRSIITTAGEFPSSRFHGSKWTLGMSGQQKC